LLLIHCNSGIRGKESRDTQRDNVLAVEELRLAGCSRCTHATSLGVWIVSDIPPLVWSMTKSVGGKSGL
jgi:hypothetical protein